jgi:putative NADH-flavin reductase
VHVLHLTFESILASMRVLILGATGAVGILLIREALSRSHTVVIFARSPEKLPTDISNNRAIVIIKGQLSDSDGLSKAMEGVDVVVSALGPTVRNGPFHPTGTPLAKAYSLILEIMHKHTVNRLVALGTTSIKDSNDKFNYQFWFLINSIAIFARTAYKDIVTVGNVIRAEGEKMDWTLVRVPILGNEEKKEFVVGYVGDGKTTAWLTRSALATFMVNEAEKTDSEWTRKAPLLSSP